MIPTEILDIEITRTQKDAMLVAKLKMAGVLGYPAWVWYVLEHPMGGLRFSELLLAGLRGKPLFLSIKTRIAEDKTPYIVTDVKVTN